MKNFKKEVEGLSKTIDRILHKLENIINTMLVILSFNPIFSLL